MHDVTFDTLAYSKALQAAGLPPEQAEALTQAQKAVLTEVFATRDLARQSDIARLEARIETIRRDLIKWIVGVAAAQIALLLGLIFFY